MADTWEDLTQLEKVTWIIETYGFSLKPKKVGKHSYGIYTFPDQESCEKAYMLLQQANPTAVIEPFGKERLVAFFSESPKLSL